MKALKTGFAKWVGALAIATLAPLAQAIPVGNFTGAGHTLGPLNSFNNSSFSPDITGLVIGATYNFSFDIVLLNGPFDPANLSHSIGSFTSVDGETDGEFVAASDTEFWDFVLDPSGNDPTSLDIIRAKISCSSNSLVLCDRPSTNVPEPGTLMLVGAGLLAGAAIRRRKPV